MQASDLPTRFNYPFASGADPTRVSLVPDTTTVAGRASMIAGFDPTNFMPTGAGGIPPFGKDMAGLHQQETAWLRWVASGGPIVFNAGYQTIIGGYPSGAMVSLNGNPTKYAISLVENNLQDPSASGQTQWAVFGILQPTTWRSLGAVTGAPADNTINVTVPNGYDSIEAILVGPGGPGAGSDTLASNQSGGGGGAGAYIHAIWNVPNNATCTITAGFGGFNLFDVAENSNGTKLTVNGTLYATAGAGLPATISSGASVGANGGTATVAITPVSGLIVQAGGAGKDGEAGSGGLFAGNGAEGPWGGGGKSGLGSAATGGGYGGGGGGAYTNASISGAYYGGSGGPGILLWRFVQFL